MTSETRRTIVVWTLVSVAALACHERGEAPSPSSARPVGPHPVVESWARWPMPNARLAGLPHPHDYDTGTSGVVIDRVTGLMWQRTVPNQFFTFESAASRCASLRLGGHHDWRLPSRIELVSLIDTTRTQPSIDMAAFPDTPLDWFWTASRAADDPRAAWYVYFYFGYPKTDDVTSRFSVRCVRPTGLSRLRPRGTSSLPMKCWTLPPDCTGSGPPSRSICRLRPPRPLAASSPWVEAKPGGSRRSSSCSP